jgi:hypothetical protein
MRQQQAHVKPKQVGDNDLPPGAAKDAFYLMGSLYSTA